MYGGVGGSLSVGKPNDHRTVLFTSDFYSISTLLEAYYAFDYQFDYASQMLNVHVEVIHYIVPHSMLDEFGFVKTGEHQSFDHPYFAVEYKHQWAEIVHSFVFFEVQYSTVVFRDPKPWENHSYLYGTLGLNFSF